MFKPYLLVWKESFCSLISLRIFPAMIRIILIVFFFSFFINAYYIDVGFSLKLFMILSFLFLVLLLNKLKVYFLPHDYLMALFFSYYMTTSFWADNMVQSFRLVLGIILMLGIYVLLKSLFKFFYKKTNIESLLIYSYVLFVSLSLILYILGLLEIYPHFWKFNGENVYGVTIDRGIPRLIGLTLDPNFFCIYLIPLFYLLLFKENKKLFEYIILMLTILCIFLTLSRGGIIAIFGVLLIYLTFRIVKGVLRGKICVFEIKILISLLIISVLLFIAYLNNEAFHLFIQKRLSNIAQASGRLDIWKHGIEIWKEHPLLGIGVYNFLYYNSQLFNDYHYMHNTHLEVLVESGIIGFSLYSFFLISLFIELVKLIKKNRRYMYILLAYISFLIGMSSLSMLINEVWILFLSYVSHILYTNNQQRYKY